MTIPCPVCGTGTEATVRQVAAEVFIPIMGDSPLSLVLPAWECLRCGQTWEDTLAATMRDHARREALGEGNDQW